MAWCRTDFECLLEKDNYTACTPYCFYAQAKFVFEAAQRRSWTRRWPTKYHTCSVGDISGKQTAQERICMDWAQQKSRIVFAAFRRALFCWKITPAMPWKEGTTSGSSTSRRTCCYWDYPQFVANWIVLDAKSHPRSQFCMFGHYVVR